MERVIRDVKRDTEAEIARLAGSGPAKSGGTDVNGAKGSENGAGAEDSSSVNLNVNSNLYPLAVPKLVRDEGLRITRECLEVVCEMEA